MPQLKLSDRDITAVIAFLTWVSKIDTQGWPPRPILVRGSAVPGANVGALPVTAASSDPAELGRALFNASPPACGACHSIASNVNLVGPSLAGIAATAANRVRGSDYHGKAKDAPSYIRESILDPNAHVLVGPTYSTGGRSLMPSDYAQTLKPDQVDEIVAYLLTLK
jgi:nitric oxide reductase subunit C